MLSRNPHEGRKKGRRIVVHEWIASTTIGAATCEAIEAISAAKEMFPRSS
jgi:hypothetical protein